MDVSNLSDAEFKTLVIRMLKEIVRTFIAEKNPVRNKGDTH